MRYILSSAFQNELLARKAFIETTTKLWTYAIKHDHYIELISIPSNCLDVLFIAGHNTFVAETLYKINAVHEKTIVAICCIKGLGYKQLDLHSKKLLICKQSFRMAHLLDGSQFHLDFNPTESELLFYNCPENDIITRLSLCFDQIA